VKLNDGWELAALLFCAVIMGCVCSVLFISSGCHTGTSAAAGASPLLRGVHAACNEPFPSYAVDSVLLLITPLRTCQLDYGISATPTWWALTPLLTRGTKYYCEQVNGSAVEAVMVDMPSECCLDQQRCGKRRNDA
jgi:hypothetical protein